jgi:hypothetical protein
MLLTSWTIESFAGHAEMMWLVSPAEDPVLILP